MEEKPGEEPLSLPGYFMQGARKGLYITLELIAPAMVMAYVLIVFLKESGLMPVIGTALGPLMGLFGLPGEASVVLLAAFFAKAAGCATAASLFAAGVLSREDATVLFPACIMMGTLIGHFARIILVCQVRPVYYSLMLAVPLADAAVVMWLTRLVLSWYR